MPKTIVNFPSTLLLHSRLFTVLLVFWLITGCKQQNSGPHFTAMKSRVTNIDFNNLVIESDLVNVYENEYMYNGSGVGIGDFNNDGLQDVFFCGSMVSSKLYINKGNFVFTDVTEAAGITTSQWCTGVSVIDINNDGFLDLYVCSSHNQDTIRRKNMLFINDGHLHFTDQAAAYGLADTGFSTQAAFLDYDKDGDLDMYLLNHRLYNPSPNNLVPRDTSGFSPAQDKLYQNQGNSLATGHPVFQNVSLQSGIKEDGYGLGIVVTDVNNDNWPDIYIANDYIGNDLLWLNNKNGTFTNIIASAIKHQSFNSMGVDAADVNNDGLADIAVLDMSPEVNGRKKMMFSGSGQERYDMERRMGYEPAFVRNMLQLNNGNNIGENNNSQPYYSEIGQLAGIAETDWSWSILMADFDNDGFKDVHITNGLAKDVTNNDYVAFKNAQSQQTDYFSAAKPKHDKKNIALLRENLDQFGSVRINNYLYHNNGDLTFTAIGEQAGLAVPSVSNGAAYADLDNDGDLDMLVNNMNEPAFVWRNDVRKAAVDSLHPFVTVQLQGPANNRQGLGAKVWLYQHGQVQFIEESPVRGFSSCVDNRLHFGLGNYNGADSLRIVWPDDRSQLLKHIAANSFVIVNYNQSQKRLSPNVHPTTTILSEVTDNSHDGFVHKESQYFDFGAQRALPQRYSQLGPALATGDVNGDGFTDYFVGGAAGQSGEVYLQQPDASFRSRPLITGLKAGEDLGAVFFDSDGDNDLDLLITGGSAEFGENSLYNQPRFYSNDGKGNFTVDFAALPNITDITKEVAVADYDLDGDLDIFIAGRLITDKYPAAPRSYLLQNNHGRFSDVTAVVCPALLSPGLITGVVFQDVNNDKLPDLIICGEWMPVQFFMNQNGRFEDKTSNTGLMHLSGQWRSLQAADIDGDGDLDLIAGNLGLNNKYHVSPDRPLKLYAADFDGNGTVEIIPAYYLKDERSKYKLFPGLDRTQLADQLPTIKKKYLLSAAYSTVTMQTLLGDLGPRQFTEKSCEITSTVWLQNQGNGKFVQHNLPLQAQFAPVNAIIAKDMDGDGIIDLLLAGNEYQSEVVAGRYDASYGVFLKGQGNGAFGYVNNNASGFFINGDVRNLSLLDTKKGTLVLAAVNDGKLRRFLKRQL